MLTKVKKKKRSKFIHILIFLPFLCFLDSSPSLFFVDTFLRNHVRQTRRRIDTLITLELELECHFNSPFATVSRKPPNDPVTYYQASDSNSVSNGDSNTLRYSIQRFFFFLPKRSLATHEKMPSCVRNFIRGYDGKYL